MKIVIDTHTLFWFITGDKRLTLFAKNTLESAEQIFTPTIVLLELFSLMKNKGLLDTFYGKEVKLEAVIGESQG